MLVRALKQGYAGKDGHQWREPGDVFEIEDDIANVSLKRGDTWFEPVKDDRAKPAAKGKADNDLA
ncbi:hypothetical protein ACUXAV_005121 [Cupriavidus metallidurans]|uniref:hypothetical protein n=1 Tax=Cupriavidus metallidurans TaxID=119219 RepID=UPI0004937A5F|nr:hypothetical protein [Cupriavidus metallidurans]MDE4917777.1 hypothetical protein [Cupriavidus metallidurans]